ncbi:hypothetical protein Fcan01_25850 [Folsomia candida]|uniref:Uncharacterized protein n=1 Tax=Folsomia candida TaxID=158441 RepID=A0A226D0X5_FOLCA|nr:hypothetical protein Fcan01_25850 [Folsomia candida]
MILPQVIAFLLLGPIALAANNQDDSQNCLFIYREYKPDDYIASFIYLTSTSQMPEISPGLATWTIFTSTFNGTSLLINQPRLATDCIVLFIFLIDLNQYPNLRHDQQNLFSYYYNSSNAVFLIALHQRVGIPWGKSPSSVYLHLFSSPKYMDYYNSKNGGAGDTYEPIPQFVTSWDIFQRKWRPHVTSLIKWNILSGNKDNKACVPRSKSHRIKHNSGDGYFYPCSDIQEVYYLLEKRFNISIVYNIWINPSQKVVVFNTIYLSVALTSSVTDFDGILRLYSVHQRHIMYFRAVAKFESTWTVWFTPYDYHCWIAVCITVCLLPTIWVLRLNLIKWFFYYAFEVHFLISIAFRQPIRSYPIKYIIFAFTMLIISSGYESIITMKLMLPTELFQIENIAEFIKLRGYKEIIVDGRYDKGGYNISVNDVDIRNEFAKHDLTKELVKVFQIVSSEFISLYDYIYGVLAWKNSTSGFLFSLDEGLGNLKLYSETIEMMVKVYFKPELGEEIKCGTFHIGGVIHVYGIISADYFWDIDRFMRYVLWESGLTREGPRLLIELSILTIYI